MTIHKFLPNGKTGNYTAFDNGVLRMTKDMLKDGAKVMYMFIASFQNGKQLTHGYIAKSLGYSENTIQSYFRDLKALDLVVIDRVGAKNYDCYIGSTQRRASDVRTNWKILTESDADPIRGEYDLNNRRNHPDQFKKD